MVLVMRGKMRMIEINGRNSSCSSRDEIVLLFCRVGALPGSRWVDPRNRDEIID